MTYLSPQQVGVLLEPIKPHRVGKDKKGLSHVEAYEIRAHLNRLFGFARWSADVLAMELIDEKYATITKDGKPKDVVTVAYRACLRLTVCAPDGTVLATYTEWATGDAPNFPAYQWPDAHDFAAKTSESQALKRCAMNLGEQFGLSLYKNGSIEALVKVTLVGGSVIPSDIQDQALSEPSNVAGSKEQGEGSASPATTSTEEGVGSAPPSSVDPPPAPHEFRPDRDGVTCSVPGCGQERDRPAHVANPGADHFRSLLLAASTKADVIQALRQLEMKGLGEIEVGDKAGIPVLLRDLGARILKEVAG